MVRKGYPAQRDLVQNITRYEPEFIKKIAQTLKSSTWEAFFRLKPCTLFLYKLITEI